MLRSPLTTGRVFSSSAALLALLLSCAAPTNAPQDSRSGAADSWGSADPESVGDGGKDVPDDRGVPDPSGPPDHASDTVEQGPGEEPEVTDSDREGPPGEDSGVSNGSDEGPRADGPLDPGVPAVDCSPIAKRWSLCKATSTTCEAVFTDGTGCRAVCAAAGLACLRVFENVDDACAPDLDRPELTCDPPSNHRSDYCVCGVGPEPPPVCRPRTCTSAMLQCGQGHDDGCGGTFDCPGSCPAGLPCMEGLCGWPRRPCTPEFCQAFPGAEGEGMFARGGRGGDVCKVTSLADSGKGTLRECIETQSGPRTVVFAVAGTITLESPLVLSKDRLTLAGQTAPGEGVQIRGYQVEIRADDVIVQHLRFRPGDVRKKRCPDGTSGFTEDALTISGRRVMIDHVSASWGIDENLSGGSAFSEVTIQWSIVAEGLAQTGLHHGECDDDYAPGGTKRHSMGSLFKPSRGNGSITVHHTLYAHNGNRNPAIGTYEGDQEFRADLRNNVIYNCPSMGYSSGASRLVEMNYVGNYAVFGPSSSSLEMFRCDEANHVRMHQSRNLRDSTRNGRFDGVDSGWAMFGDACTRVATPFSFRPVTTHAPDVALDLVLRQAGARPWSRDAVDRRIVDSVRNGTGRLIDSPSQVGGWGDLDPGTPFSDRDDDGIPDDWEVLYGTNPAHADHDGDLDGDGYTNLEAYLHWAARPR